MLRSEILLRYLWEIYRELPGSWNQKKKLLSRVDRSIRDYLSSGGEISYNRIKERFGEPKQIVSAYVEEMEADEMLVHMKVGKKIARIFFAAAAVALVMWAGCVVAAYINVQRGSNGYAIVEVIEIEDIKEGA